MYAVYPKDVYLILPYNQDGNVAGVYVGATVFLEDRINAHIYRHNDESAKSKEMHELMRNNGFVCAVVDKIEDCLHSYIEYDWVDYFLHEYNVRLFNSTKLGCRNRDWRRILSPMNKLLYSELYNNQDIFNWLLSKQTEYKGEHK